MAVVALVNLKLVTSTSSHDGGVAILALLSLLVYLGFNWGVNLIPSSDIYRTFTDIFLYSNFFPDLFIMTVSLVMIDIGMYHVQHGIKYIMEQRELEAEDKRKEKMARDSATLVGPRTSFTCNNLQFVLEYLYL